jgi:hypothetical protein
VEEKVCTTCWLLLTSRSSDIDSSPPSSSPNNFPNDEDWVSIRELLHIPHDLVHLFFLSLRIFPTFLIRSRIRHNVCIYLVGIGLHDSHVDYAMGFRVLETQRDMMRKVVGEIKCQRGCAEIENRGCKL